MKATTAHHGNALVLVDISEGVPTETIRQRWADDHYGPRGKRPRGEYVKGWLSIAGRKA